MHICGDGGKEKVPETTWDQNFERNQTQMGSHRHLGDIE